MKYKSQYSIAILLEKAAQQLSQTSTSAMLDAEILLAFCMQKNRSYLLAWSEVVPSAVQQTQFQQLISQRQDGLPIAYMMGAKAFWTLELKVNPEVLIPRPETEHLVETALDKIQNIPQPHILDLGTGSGAIALALATERTDANIIALEQSASALNIAQENKEKYRLDNVQLLQSDWFKILGSAHLASFDLIVSNPPYIETNDPHLLTDIQHEPTQALTSGADGLEAIRTIIAHAPAYLKPNSFLIIEHGYNQGSRVRELLHNKSFGAVETIKDYAQHERLSLGSLIKKPL